MAAVSALASTEYKGDDGRGESGDPSWEGEGEDEGDCESESNVCEPVLKAVLVPE